MKVKSKSENSQDFMNDFWEPLENLINAAGYIDGEYLLEQAEERVDLLFMDIELALNELNSITSDYKAAKHEKSNKKK